MIKGFDYDKCSRCGRCISDCPTNYILANDEKYPLLAERGRCIGCSHCFSVCPNNAIYFEDADSYEYNNDDILKLMAVKRTVRNYKKGGKIDKDVLEKILRAAQSAPTEKNRKTVRIILVKDKLPDFYNLALDYLVSYVNEAGAINPMYAPTMELDKKRHEVLWNAEYLVIYAGSPVYIADAAISAERMQIYAEYMGVGTGYRGDMKIAINNSEELRKMLNMRKNEEALITFALGIPKFKYKRPAIKINRKVEIL